MFLISRSAGSQIHIFSNKYLGKRKCFAAPLWARGRYAGALLGGAQEPAGASHGHLAPAFPLGNVRSPRATKDARTPEKLKVFLCTAVLGCSWLSCFGLGTILCCLPGFAVAAARRVWMAAALQQLESLKHERMDFVPHSLERARAELPAVLALVWWLLPLFQVLEPSSHSRLLKTSQTLPGGG